MTDSIEDLYFNFRDRHVDHRRSLTDESARALHEAGGADVTLAVTFLAKPSELIRITC